MSAPPLHLAVALDGAGWHPAAWREPDARPAELFTAGYWVDLVREAERGLLDFVTIEDCRRPAVRRLARSPDDADRPGARPPRRRAHRRAGGAADPPHRARPDRHVTHTEPFHVVQGDRHPRLRQQRPGRRGGCRSRGRPHEAAHFGRRGLAG